MNFPDFLAELKRRRVYQVVVGYVIVAWFVIQFAFPVFPVFGFPDWTLRFVIILLAIGGIVGGILAWLFETTSKGIVRASDTSPTDSRPRKTSRILISVITLMGIAAAAGLTFQLLSKRNPAIKKQSIAVLPFVYLNRDSDIAFVAEGISEAVTARLQKVRALTVVSSVSTRFLPRSHGIQADTMTRLSVGTVLQGSVQQVGDELTTTIYVTRAKPGHASQHSRTWKLDNLLGIDADIAKRVVDDLAIDVAADESRDLQNQLTNSPKAFEDYLTGMAILTAPLRLIDYVEAAKAFEAAVKKDPFFATAWAKLAQCRAKAHSRVATDGEATADNARVALETASRLAPDAVETLIARGYYERCVLNDSKAATATLERANMLSSDSAIPLELALLERQSGNWDECITRFERLSRTDPLNFDMLQEGAVTNLAARRFAPALELIDRTLSLHPKDLVALLLKVELYHATGDIDAAGKVLDLVPKNIEVDVTIDVHFEHAYLRRDFAGAAKMMEEIDKEFASDGKKWGGLAHAKCKLLLGLAEQRSGDTTASIDLSSALRFLLALEQAEPKNPEYALLISRVHAALGRKEEAIDAATRALKIAAKWNDHYEGPLYEINLAGIQAKVGDKDQAISALERLIKAPANSFAPLTREILFIDPGWDVLRTSRRFQQLCLGRSEETTPR